MRIVVSFRVTPIQPAAQQHQDDCMLNCHRSIPPRKRRACQGDSLVAGAVNFDGGPCYTCALAMEVPLTPPRGRR